MSKSKNEHWYEPWPHRMQSPWCIQQSKTQQKQSRRIYHSSARIYRRQWRCILTLLSREYRVVSNRYSWLWRHNAKSETTVLGHSGKMSDGWLFLAETCVSNIKRCVRNKSIHSLLWEMIFLWCDLPMIFTCDFAIRENLWKSPHSWLKNCYSQ